MKICMICLGLGNLDEMPLVGGHENTVIRICKEISQAGDKIIIITTPSIHSSRNHYRVFDVGWAEIHSLPISSSYGSYRYGLEFVMKTARELKKIRSVDKISLIHGHSGYPILGLISGLMGRVYGVPSIHTLYCPLENKNLLSRFCLLLPNEVISLSNNTKKSLIDVGISNSKIMVIPPPIDISSFNKNAEKMPLDNFRKVLEDDPFLLYIGDLTEKRGLNILIDSLARVAIKYPNVRLLLAVNMPLDKYLNGNFDIKRKISSLGLDDNVLPIGIVPNMPEVMARSDIFVAPYLSIESIADYPLSMLEAMACGIPVISTNVGGISEIVKDNINGLLIPPNDVIQLADSIDFLLKNKDKAESFATISHNCVVNNYSSSAVSQKHKQLYLKTSQG